jgi:hypothetical protein
VSAWHLSFRLSDNSHNRCFSPNTGGPGLRIHRPLVGHINAPVPGTFYSKAYLAEFTKVRDSDPDGLPSAVPGTAENLKGNPERVLRSRRTKGNSSG